MQSPLSPADQLIWIEKAESLPGRFVEIQAERIQCAIEIARLMHMTLHHTSRVLRVSQGKVLDLFVPGPGFRVYRVLDFRVAS